MLPDAAVAVSEGVPRSWAGSGRLSAASSARPERAPSVGQSAEFRALWDKHEVGVRPRHVKRFVHPEAGALELNCQTLLDPEPSHRLVVYTAAPGSESHDRLRLLAVIGPQAMR
ncbi:hypothetical protein M6G08_24535 [Streptomyces sp. M92]|nr:hypothetical protein [Streptomyces sp. M92]WCN05033.1 hypothetical protein M6G08_24535 [Streptomyces sp. M92]